jgi:hypothetical protein
MFVPIATPEQFVPVGVVDDLVVTDALALRAPPAEIPGLAKVTVPVTGQTTVPGVAAPAGAELTTPVATADTAPIGMAIAAIAMRILLIMV